MKATLYAALLSLTVILPTQAHEIEHGSVMICDTQKQAERLGQLFEGKPQVAIAAVNVEENSATACGVAEVTYVQGKVLGTVRSKSHTFHVIPIIVVAVNTPAGLQPVNSAVYFTLVQVREYSI